ncbi:MAG TPA: hypothetical protein VIL46_11500, partial [Gemmataceae bacterium]
MAVFAFLLASFPARNSDVWAHLAAGRQLAQGDFASAANLRFPGAGEGGQTWLYDLLSYGVYSALGGTGLVLAKALLVAATGLILLRLSRGGTGWWLPAACTTLALLAMGTRLYLEPATVSYLFLALTFWFLRPRGGVAPGQLPPVLPPWPLLLLFVAWANTDPWFVLGLGAVALVWLGHALDGPAPVGRSVARRGVSFALLAAACLLNPSHVYAFALPEELLWFGAAPAASPAGQVWSPFQWAYVSGVGLSPAGLAYYPLLALGMISFALNLPGWRWRRFLPWLGLAAVTVLQVRAVPFFAVVAGPVLARNLQDWAARRTYRAGGAGWDEDPAWRPLSAALRAEAAMLGAALLVCAWPGWLRSPPYEPRRWGIETAPSLERGAAAVARWRQEGKVAPGARGLHLSPATAEAFAWFCPEGNGVVDEALAAAVRGDPGAPADWRERMRAAGVNHVIVYDRDPRRLFATLARMLADPVQWPLLFLEGDLVIFGWRDRAAGGSEDPFRGRVLDLTRLAFDPPPEERAPADGPGGGPAPRRWWEAFWKPARPPSLAGNEARLYLLYAELRRQAAPFRHMDAWEAGRSAALAGAGAGWGAAAGGGAGPGALFDAHLRLVLLQPQVPAEGFGPETLPPLDRVAHALQRGFVQRRDDTPPALLYLAVRAARRAVRADPRDTWAHEALGEAYLRFLRETRERAWGARLPPVAELRRAQAIAALNRALTLRPDLADVHFRLAGLYSEMGIHDLALKHLQTYAELTREAVPPPGMDPELFRSHRDVFLRNLGRLAEEVADAQSAYAAESGGLRVLDRALLAVEKGLAGKALDLLLGSDVAAFGARGMELELELLLRTGRPEDVWRWTEPEQQAALGPQTYHWLRTRALAATGDYARAREECSLMAQSFLPGAEVAAPVPPRQVMAMLIGQTVLGAQPGLGPLPSLYGRVVGGQQLAGRSVAFAQGLRQQADAAVLLGLLALEEGDVSGAGAAFREALGVWGSAELAAGGGGLDFDGRVIAQECLEWLG